jgi:hypothetical protein
MESVMNNMAPAYYFYTPEQTDARRHGAFIPQQPQQQPAYYYMMPATPTYSRPTSSCSQQPQPVLMSQPQPLKSFPNGAAAPYPAAAYIVGSNARRSVTGANGKPTIMLETDFVDVDGHGLRLPSTPPLSSSASSAIGSPSACDMLATPLNPMFSGLDSFEVTKDASAVDVAAEQFNAAAWSNCASPPFTPGKFDITQQIVLFFIACQLGRCFVWAVCWLGQRERRGESEGAADKAISGALGAVPKFGWLVSPLLGLLHQTRAPPFHSKQTSTKSIVLSVVLF